MPNVARRPASIASIVLALLVVPRVFTAEAPPALPHPVPLFDGRTLAGWEGQPRLWRVQDGALTGGSLTETVKENEFLATTRDFTNFIVRLEIKLTGSNGFINSGFQIRSQRVPRSSEMAGYQCDFGEPDWYGAIYDESRRNKLMAASDMAALRPVLRQGDWNEYVIRADGPRITTWINGVLGVDYTEPDLSLPNYDWGKLGIQVHGGGRAVAQVRNIVIEELPSGGPRFLGAPEPPKPPKVSPLTAAEEQTTFTLPSGFEIELVAQESEGIGKFVAVDWDLRGRMWSMTALEYPVDANESPAAARELYARAARDKVLVFDQPYGPGPHTPRVFADGLAIPLGILPYKNGVFVQHGPDIVFLNDTDSDGRSDTRQVVLGGFGVQDSHLFPHQFTRGPGNWIWMAQGAFNYGKVRTTQGEEVQFDQTRMARFRANGSEFDITSQGPCNIWGLVLTAEGEAWIQEANDFGYPAMPFQLYANYPGCSDAQWKSYAPEFPATAPDFRMGGTGLSGLALTDQDDWPAPYNDILYVANPITRAVQAIRIQRDGARVRLQKLPDFLRSSDEWFRPVALRLGPDGCLYLVDWYNKIISHNEVPRNHPDRDKTRGRIWRVRHRGQQSRPVPNFVKLTGNELLAKLGGPSTPQSHMAWQTIVDRPVRELAPRLQTILADPTQSAGRRIAALWAFEGLAGWGAHPTWVGLLTPLLSETNRHIRREAVRVFGEDRYARAESIESLADDPDPDVRAEVLRSAGRMLDNAERQRDPATANPGAREVALLVRMARAPLPGPTAKSTQNGRVIKVGAAYDREFERYLARMFLEKHPAIVAAFLESPDAHALPVENRLLATLALEPEASASHVAALLPQLGRAPGQEELLRLAQYPDTPGVLDALKQTLESSTSRSAALESLLQVRTRLDPAKLTPLLTDVARRLWGAGAADRVLALRLIGSFKLAALEPDLNEALTHASLAPAEALGALRALRELGGGELAGAIVHVRSPQRDLAEAALSVIVSSRNETAPGLVLTQLWSGLSPNQRRLALTGLSGHPPGAHAIVRAVRDGVLAKDELDGPVLDRLHTVLGQDEGLAALLQEMEAFLRPVLRLDGTDDAWVDSNITLDGAFTVETWVKLDPGIDNNDGLLGAPDVVDMNSYGGQFRVYGGSKVGDVIVSRKPMVPDTWTHLAVTRDVQGWLSLYRNGELDNDQGRPFPQRLAGLRIGWTTPGQGTAGWLTEYRIWDRARTAAEIRADFDRSFGGEPKQALVHYFPGAGPWGQLRSGARVTKTPDFPPLLSPAEARTVAEKFAKFRLLAEQAGDTARGQTIFRAVCAGCHRVGGQGGQVGPVLDGAGALGMEALLRNILTPNAAMEPGYRMFRVELRDGELVEGIRVSEDAAAIVLRRPNVEDARIAQKVIRKASFTKLSMMPEGLLEGLKPEEVSDLLAYLKTLK
jgi:putative membrane-bound dehydrogenase-like protein